MPVFSKVNYTSAEGFSFPFPICHLSFTTKESAPIFYQLTAPVHPPDFQGSTVVLFFIHASRREKNTHKAPYLSPSKSAFALIPTASLRVQHQDHGQSRFTAPLATSSSPTPR